MTMRILWPNIPAQYQLIAREAVGTGPESIRPNRGFSTRTAGGFFRDGWAENCVKERFLVTRG